MLMTKKEVELTSKTKTKIKKLSKKTFWGKFNQEIFSQKLILAIALYFLKLNFLEAFSK